MHIAFLPTDSGTDLVVLSDSKTLLQGLGHDARLLQTKEDFHTALQDGCCLGAYGTLSPLGIWMWGYANAKRRKVVVFKGVTPLLQTNPVAFEQWLERVPQQLSMFSEEGFMQVGGRQA